jgi:hypothetical protein
MIGRADIEGSKSNVAMNAWLPQASYPCGNFSDTSSWVRPNAKGSIGHAFAVLNFAETQNETNFSPFGQCEISVLVESVFGHLRCILTDVPPQPNSLSEAVLVSIRGFLMPFYQVCKTTLRVVVFHCCRNSHLYYTS